jgi:hypothetical protein
MGGAIFFSLEYPSTTTLRNILQCISPYLLRCAEHHIVFFFESQAVSGYLCKPASLGCELELNADIFMNATYLEA